ncbi:MAG: alpha-1,4 polygalactosaminidase [Spirochaetae bacterium HGW-Spirochaetae-1]|jgi:hypothetical protein|nr:MAG: alpha-1,4 polygalactosaminidase [Spirochaetae bacterium HGW-Spirochaetae-1]
MNHTNDDQLEEVEIVSNVSNNWNPIVGEETIALLNHLPINERSRIVVRNEAVSILSKCISPLDTEGQQTGLVLGYVQSGKTLSFTTVATLARDNGFPIIILIAGISNPLTTQSRDRLHRDLRLEVRDDRVWRHLHNPDIQNRAQDQINNIIEEWRDPSVPLKERTTLLITTMKNHRRLANLREVFMCVDLRKIPVLIFDDEADQAGLNNLIKQGEESTTYTRLRELKEIIPHHTFLQYTATPQGPLLINLIDILSPGFANTLTPGDDYTGGRDFFINNQHLLREIPFNEIPTNDNPIHEPPESLLAALRVFFLGLASTQLRHMGHGNRSMMVHPSHKTDPHQQYYDWIINIINNWKTILANKDDPDYNDLKEEFRLAYDDLASTIDSLEEFDSLYSIIHRVIRRTEIIIINARRGRTPEIDWRGAFSHILVGGQALDRGFTIEGLTVTYMPRGVGGRQADTIQQRARFFGYKRSYLGYCRIYIERELNIAFTRYVQHEEDIRDRLIEYENRPLRDLRRAFLIPQGFKATRDSIIDVDYTILRFNNEWFYPQAPQDSIESIIENRNTVFNFIKSISLSQDDGHPDRTPYQRHLFSDTISLKHLYENLLLDLRFTRLSDAQNFLAIIILLRNFLENSFSDEECSVYYMSQGINRERKLDAKGELVNLFQGAYPVNPKEIRGSIYAGDRYIHSNDNITVQIHMLNILDNDKKLIYDNPVANIAIFLPERLKTNVLIQNQGGIDSDEE